MTVNGTVLLGQLLALAFSVSVALYVPHATEAGIVKAMGEAGSVAFVTSTRPAALAAAS